MKFSQLFQRVVMGGIALAMAACVAPPAAQTGDGSAAAQPPIKIGMTSGRSGPFVELEPEAIMQAYVAKVNSEGGINGHMVELSTADDKTDPGIATQSVHRMVDDEGVVAMVGGASALDCAVNGAYYAEKGIISIPGTGVDPVCTKHPNISAVNTGPFLATTLMLQYANKNLGKEKLCGFFAQIPGAEPAYREAVAAWEANSGLMIVQQDYSFKAGDDPTPLILNAKSAGCDAVLVASSASDAVVWVKAANTQNMRQDVSWLFLASIYTAETAKALGAEGDGIYANSEFEPWTGDSAALAGWKKLSEGAGVPLTSFSLGSYLAAEIFFNTIKGIHGEITRESVAAAFKAMQPYKTSLMGLPFTFGDAPFHAANQAAKIMTLKDGKWTLAEPDWVVIEGAK